ncbi:MAG: prepilin-type N-terminal cleavage/methylation domain-containing protein [Fimbriimonadales bacterium]
MQRRRRPELGLSLVELLVVVAIIALLVALLLPVLHQARKRSYTSTCISNLRQLVAAATMYRNDYGEYPLYMEEMTGYVKDSRLWICPAEPTPEYPDKVAGNRRPPHVPKRVVTSYYYFTDLVAKLQRRVALDLYQRNQSLEVYTVRRLREADPHHGLFACILHGEREAIRSRRHYITHLDYRRGLTLRALQDGSVQRIQTEMRSLRDGSGAVRDLWPMFTDTPCPPEFCHEEY